MFRFSIRAALLASVVALPVAAHEEHAPRKTELFGPGVGHAESSVSDQGAPVMVDGLGEFGMTIETSSSLAQDWFDQGLGHLWGFNHAEAVRAFREAQKADPDCAMCYWGEAYALGPNLNDGMHPENEARAIEASSIAAGLASAPVEVALTKALAARYAGEDGGADFADLMEAAAEAFPDDVNVQVIFADALMNQQPWDYWKADGVTPKGRGGDIVATLEHALTLSPDHPAALHLYIHAVEASADPGRAEDAADRLAGSVPSAGHLVHMPAHIYNRIGRYADSIEVNRDAIAADEAFLGRAGEAASELYRYGYYPHNVHFLLVGAQSAGLAEDALAAAGRLDEITSGNASAGFSSARIVSGSLNWACTVNGAVRIAWTQARSAETSLMIVEFSRGSRPNCPNSQERETAMSGTSFLMISAARRSMSPFTGENTDVTAAACRPAARIARAASATALSSSGAISRPSNS